MTKLNVGTSINQDLERRMRIVMKARGYNNSSDFIRQAIRHFVDHEEKNLEG